jgi:tetratricopeptide (TPR) repeat protein
VTLALAYLQMENYREAETLLLQAKALAPEDAALWSPLAHVYNESKRYAQAAAVAQEVMRRLPSNAPIVVELGKACYYQNDFAGAESAFRQALTLQQDDLSAHYYLGMTYQRREQIPQAITELEYVLQRSPDFEQTRRVLGNLYLRQNRTDEGRKLIAESDRIQAQAQKHGHVNHLVALRPNDPEAHWQMAQVYHEEQNDSRARVELKKTLELKPDHAGAQQLLAQMQAAGVR